MSPSAPHLGGWGATTPETEQKRHVGNGPCSDEARVQRDNAFWIPLFGSAALGAATGNVGLSAFVGSMALHRTGIAFRDKWHPETSVAKKKSAPIAKWITYAIAKNREFSELSYSEKVLTRVVNAFENGNMDDPVLSAKALDLQLTQATKEGLFSSNAHGLDAWQMFSWMQQFSDKQEIHDIPVPK